MTGDTLTTALKVFLVLAALAGFGACCWWIQNDCDRRHCERGHPDLIRGECLCVEDAKP